MTKRYNLIVILLSLAISAGIWIITLNKQSVKKEKHFAARVFGSFHGWGYDILVNDSLLIRQESVPVLEGKKGFQKKEQAEQVAQLIINKLKRGQHPSVAIFELEQILLLNETQHGQPGKSK